MADKPDPAVRVVDRRWWARTDEQAGTDEAPSRKPTYVEELEGQVAAHAARLHALADEHRKSLEELEQVKLRIRRDAARDVERARRTVLAELLEIVDNLDRAIAAAEAPASAPEALLRGVALVRDQCLAKLAAFGVARLEVLGHPFDATRHDAVSMAPVAALADDGRVVGVAKQGYAIGEELLRPASVIVGQFRG